ncbi:MAG: indolepyruvate oxidoreductase subunit beta [Candidatus Bathyarchaeota archaeon]|uniref:indolepyruvate oxidoreductase subunit beta n=1 Tax=Candidatus Bathycorpusculum sp. TaxID=2994959 RepID=UPI00281EF321|nr:indolepyruvate oxidoreductase subunit beta [Candidatus Termiticorpusculum sp.]MCL2257346.1 indolepyruvate oxidoreductase subunit beta [Candidatus Termiticorpusculum sp.]MCL2292268.1 indolepyruvate oxidoreductase subunit beta [Candidatus Termiticorpusculum sp.]
MKLDLIFTGVGGQGIVVLSDIFCQAAMLDGFDVTKAEIHGMAQRGGSIVAYARISNKIETPLIETGKADAIVGFEILETTRTLPMLKPNGTVIVNTKHIPPNNFSKNNKPKTPQELINIIKTKTPIVHEIDGTEIAKQVDNNKVVNIVLLGALSALPNMPIKQESFKKVMTNKLKEKHLQANLQSFELGRQSVLK